MLNKRSDGTVLSLSNKLDQIIGSTRGSDKAELQAWKANGTIKDANKFLKDTLYVRTILSTKGEQNLLDFYYPSDLNHNNELVSFYNEFLHFDDHPSLIVGTVGQGKSIALRYACFHELCKGKSIPIFLELRKLRPSTSLFEHIRHKLIAIKLECSEKLLKFLLLNSFVSLYLDGFDEIKYENRSYWLKEIEEIHTKFTLKRILVTSRPNTDIYQSHVFRNYELEALNDSDRPPFIKKLIPNTDDQTALISKLSEANEEVKDLLRTPLLLVLFVSVYQNRRKLPNSFSDFFDELFSTILSRHDGLKPAYDRPTRTGFTDKELKSGLQSLSYQSRRNNLRQINHKTLNALATQALNTIGLDSSKTAEFIDDIKNITCILLKDGLEYRFIHDSVQEFYSASFVCAQEEVKSKFYEKYLENWHAWSAELNFLRYIDKVAYTKYFLVPSINKMCDIDEDNQVIRFKLSSLIDTIKSSNIVFYSKQNNPINYFSRVSFAYPENWAVHLLCSSKDFNQAHTIQKRIDAYIENDFTNRKELVNIVTKSDLFEVIKSEEFVFYEANLYTFCEKFNLTQALYKSIKTDDLHHIQSNGVRHIVTSRSLKQAEACAQRAMGHFL